MLYEQAGLQGDFVVYVLRSLLSEGRLKYKTVEKTADGMRTRTIVREGPTNLITTTTKVRIDSETETRLMSIPTNDSREQTTLIALTQAEAAEGIERVNVDTAPWHALYGWLQEAEHRVVIPYARRLAWLILPAAVRLRRDFPALLALIRTHAIIHQLNRARDANGRIIATLDDYAVIGGLVADLFAEGVELTVSEGVRETVQAVEDILDEVHADAFGIKTTTVATVARHLGIDKSTALRRVHAAIEGGYLRNLESREHRAARLTIGDPLPEEQPLLPPPSHPALQEGLRGCAQEGGGITPPGATAPDSVAIPEPSLGAGPHGNIVSPLAGTQPRTPASTSSPGRTPVLEGADAPLEADEPGQGDPATDPATANGPSRRRTPVLDGEDRPAAQREAAG